MYSVFLLENVI